MRSELETGRDCYILTPCSSDHSSTSFAFWLGCTTAGHWGPKPSVWSWFSLRWHPISNWLQLKLELELTQDVCGLVIFLFEVHPIPLSSVYLHRCISWLTARSRVNMQQYYKMACCFIITYLSETLAFIQILLIIWEPILDDKNSTNSGIYVKV